MIALLQGQPARSASALHNLPEEQQPPPPPPPHEAEIRLHATVRKLIASLPASRTADAVGGELIKMVTKEVMPTDPADAAQIVNKLDKDSSFAADCRHLADIYLLQHRKESRHFIFFYPIAQEPTVSGMAFWDRQFDRLAARFHNDIQNKIMFQIDPMEQYGRCFPPWEVFWGIRQNKLGDNPHELVHLMLFKYSDVPFFHEPLAFMYGTYLGDPKQIADGFRKYHQLVADSGYVTAADIFHFPQIIGLDKKVWASSFYFIEKLTEEYGLEKLLVFMGETPWSRDRDDFVHNFKAVYGVELGEFERRIVKKLTSPAVGTIQ